MVLAVFLDLKGAFETVDKEILLHKLKKIGISHEVIKWFK